MQCKNCPWLVYAQAKGSKVESIENNRDAPYKVVPLLGAERVKNIFFSKLN